MVIGHDARLGRIVLARNRRSVNDLAFSEHDSWLPAPKVFRRSSVFGENAADLNGPMGLPQSSERPAISADFGNRRAPLNSITASHLFPQSRNPGNRLFQCRVGPVRFERRPTIKKRRELMAGLRGETPLVSTLHPAQLQKGIGPERPPTFTVSHVMPCDRDAFPQSHSPADAHQDSMQPNRSKRHQS